MEPEAYFRAKSVLIAGGSSGIGEELAWQLGQAGAQLTLMARARNRCSGWVSAPSRRMCLARSCCGGT